jgi:arylsulfatase A-like enzyme
MAAREVKEASVLDLAPTILYLLGLPIPPEMDGKVLTQLFPEDYLQAHPVSYGHGAGPDISAAESQRDYSADEEAAIRTRLQGLGYIE